MNWNSQHSNESPITTLTDGRSNCSSLTSKRSRSSHARPPASWAAGQVSIKRTQAHPNPSGSSMVPPMPGAADCGSRTWRHRDVSEIGAWNANAVCCSSLPAVGCRGQAVGPPRLTAATLKNVNRGVPLTFVSDSLREIVYCRPVASRSLELVTATSPPLPCFSRISCSPASPH